MRMWPEQEHVGVFTEETTAHSQRSVVLHVWLVTPQETTSESETIKQKEEQDKKPTTFKADCVAAKRLKWFTQLMTVCSRVTATCC